MKRYVALLVLGLGVPAAAPAMARIDDGAGCGSVPRFEPGPIVNGHHRQPTPGEIAERTEELRARGQIGLAGCEASPRAHEMAVVKRRSEASPNRS